MNWFWKILKWFSQFSRRTRSNRSLFPKTSFLITKISGRRCDWLFDKSVYKACAKNRVIHFSRKIDTKCGNTVLGLTTGWLVSLVLSGQGHVSSSIVVIHVVNHRLLYFIIKISTRDLIIQFIEEEKEIWSWKETFEGRSQLLNSS